MADPKKSTLNHWRVGRRHEVRDAQDTYRRGAGGMCVSVTLWGRGRVRWVRLALDDGTEKSYAPSALRVVSR